MANLSQKPAQNVKSRSKTAKIILLVIGCCIAAALIAMLVMFIIGACGGTGTQDGSLLGSPFNAVTTVFAFLLVILVLVWLLTEPSFKKEEEEPEIDLSYRNSYVKKAANPRATAKKPEPKADEAKEEPKEEPKEEEKAEEPAQAPDEVIEEAPAEEEEPDNEDDDDEVDDDAEEDDDKDEDEVIPEEEAAEDAAFAAAAAAAGTDLVTRYRRSFKAKIIQSSTNTKDYYTQIKNKLLSYNKVKSRESWNFESFNAGRKKLVKMNIRGKTLVMYLALDPAEYENTKYHIRNVSETAKYAAVPVMVRVKSPRACKFAIELIEQLAEKNALVANAAYKDQKFGLKYKSNKKMLEEGLIKEVQGKAFVQPEPSNK